jgi:hypothetical protein
LGVSKIEGDLIGEVCSRSSVVAAGVFVCWVPVPPDVIVLAVRWYLRFIL